MDIITTLKRSIDQRIRALNSVYSFRTIPIKDKPSDTLSLLEFFGIVRPLMFQNLQKVRNAVEHEDASLPDHKSCEIFVEFTWYFLRSTDKMLQEVCDEIQLYPADDGENDYWLDLGYGPAKNWNPTLRGWVPRDLISDQPENEWIVLKPNLMETRDEAKARLKGTKAAMKKNDAGRGKASDDINVLADVRGPENAIGGMTKLYFSAV